MSAAQGLLNSVFSCSSPASKAITKRRLRQTRSLDPAIIRHCSTGADEAMGAPLSEAPAADAGALPERLAVKPSLRTKIPILKEPIAPSLSTPSIPLDVSPSSNFHFDYDIVKRAKRNTAGDLPFLVRGPGATPPGSTGTLFSPRRWLQKKVQPSSSHAYVVWKSEHFSEEDVFISNLTSAPGLNQVTPVCDQSSYTRLPAFPLSCRCCSSDFTSCGSHRLAQKAFWDG
uniref:rho GTPase-activating protein 6-like n=1 Tax=Solea senegalensis TaxID=28829 RepID=UPI001CD8EA13|nr:rho GTPase-activating protein 6-like [Solea senegalensis]